MCRYSDHGYKTSYVCLPDRHVAQYVEFGTHVRGREPLCPRCRKPMMNLGRDFHAPRKGNDPQWRKLELIARHKLFESCGCDGPGYRPRTLGEAKGTRRRKWRHANPQTKALKRL